MFSLIQVAYDVYSALGPGGCVLVGGIALLLLSLLDLRN